MFGIIITGHKSSELFDYTFIKFIRIAYVQ